MNSDSIRRIQQLERQVKELQAEVVRLRNQRQGQTGLIQPAIFKPTADINPRAVSGSNFNCPAEFVPMWDLEPPTYSGASVVQCVMKAITDGSNTRKGILVNIWSEVIASGSFVVGLPYKNVFLPVAEACE